ncbi:MAG: threonine synthase [Planctomycetota bacterium]
MSSTPTAASRSALTSLCEQRCIDPDCARAYPIDRVLTSCEACGELLDIVYDWDAAWPAGERSFELFNRRAMTTGPRHTAGAGPDDGGATESALDFSGVWRFRDLLPFWKASPQGASGIVSVGEGRTNLQRADRLAGIVGVDVNAGGRLFLEYEGFNPSGSFKDNGMTAAFTHARMVGASRVACASTGNTSASLALYASLTGVRAFVFIGEGKIAFGKLAQALDYGATTLQVAGDFDACLARVRQIAERRDLYERGEGVYLMNSVNPFRLEGQKTIMLRILEGLDWQVPDWVVVPGGNLGNCSAFGKAFIELRELGLIDRLPRLAVINARGARTLDVVYNELGVRWNGGRYDRAAVRGEFERMDAAGERAHTIASAIEINRPVNLPKALRALDAMDGVVRTVDDHCIREHKALVGRHGFGCEPASAASVAGARRLIEEGVIKPSETIACVLTGHALKDPDVTVNYHTGMETKGAGAHVPGGDVHIPLGRLANRPVRVADDLDAILAAMNG